MVVGPSTWLGLWRSRVLPGTRTETILRPGATRSGLARPSAVGPTLDHDGMLSSDGAAVLLSSEAPTVSTSGSMPGVWMVPAPGPLLPAAVTRTRPDSQASSAAAANGSSPYPPAAGAPTANTTNLIPSTNMSA